MEGSSLAIKTVPNDIEARGQGICGGGPGQQSPAHLSVLQAYQADLLIWVRECPRTKSWSFAEHQILPSRPLSILVHSIAALVDTEGHLWLNLLGLKDKALFFLMPQCCLPDFLVLLSR